MAQDTVVGAPLPQEQGEFKPMLAGFGEDKVVTIHNPLTSDFRFQHARSTVQGAPLSPEAQVAQEKGGLSMKKDGSPVAHYSQYWILKAGETKNLPGDIAQKAVQDLTTYILMNRAGKGQPKNVADGFARSQVEKEIVVSVSDNVTFFNQVTPEEYTTAQMDKLNPETPEKPVEAPKPGEGTNYEPNRTSSKASKKAA